MAHFFAFFEIYKICNPLHRSDPKNSTTFCNFFRFSNDSNGSIVSTDRTGFNPGRRTSFGCALRRRRTARSVSLRSGPAASRKVRSSADSAGLGRLEEFENRYRAV